MFSTARILLEEENRPKSVGILCVGPLCTATETVRGRLVPDANGSSAKGL